MDMEFHIQTADPFAVLSSTKTIVQTLHHITIHTDKLADTARIIHTKLDQGLDIAETHFGLTERLEDAVQLIFLEDVVNFCFWAEKDKPKWYVEWPKETVTTGGWYTLTKCFQRALTQKVPILDAEYVANITLPQVQSLFAGADNTQIPLLEERMYNLQEAGTILNEKYEGAFINVLETASFDAIEIGKILLRDFPSFADIAHAEGKEIYFLKRAQICSQDFSYLTLAYPSITIEHIDQLTAFADYKIPQMLRKYGIISYSESLAKKIDNYELIDQGSRQEIEIRSATIWCIELIRQQLAEYTASEIDNALWLISQDQTNTKPYHRTYTIYY